MKEKEELSNFYPSEIYKRSLNISIISLSNPIFVLILFPKKTVKEKKRDVNIIIHIAEYRLIYSCMEKGQDRKGTSKAFV